MSKSLFAKCCVVVFLTGCRGNLSDHKPSDRASSQSVVPDVLPPVAASHEARDVEQMRNILSRAFSEANDATNCTEMRQRAMRLGTDIWGGPIQLSCGIDNATLMSYGPDGLGGTIDDIVVLRSAVLNIPADPIMRDGAK